MHSRLVVSLPARLPAIILLVALSSAFNVAFGQANDGHLVGVVFDPAGAVVAGASVEATNTATGVRFTASTEATGVYRFLNVLVGNYDLRVTHTGFSAAQLHNLTVSLNRTSTANVTLQVGEVTTVVDVVATAALIDTTTAQITSVFQSREAIDTPSSALPMGVMNLSLLSAGVANAGGIGLGEGPTVGGQRPRNNSFNVEGIDNNRSDVTGRNIVVPNEAVAEFSVLQNQLTAEFGGSSGAHFNTVVRGGTNQIHGALFEYLQNRNLNALDQAAFRNGITSNPRYDQNTLGGSVGGSIIRDKLFYYGLYQYNPVGLQGTPSSSALAPTAAGYTMLGAIPGVSATNLNVLKQYLPAAPSATDTTRVGNVDVPIGILPLTQPSFQNTHAYLVSLDYNISDRDQVRGRFINQKTRGFDTSALGQLPSFFVGRPNTSKVISFSWLHDFSPSLLNELRAGYSRFTDDIPAGNFQFPGLDAFPNITINQDLNVQLGPYDSAPQSTFLNTYQITDNVTWTRGRHAFKFGFEGRQYINLSHFIQRERGDYGYNTLERYVLDQNPDFISERNVGAAPYSGNRPAVSLFGTDEFKLRPNLTVNAGLRWEYKAVPRDDAQHALNAIANVPGLIEFRKPTAQYANFAPRIGIAYSPGTSGRTSIRAGFGISYDKYFDNLSTNSRPAQISTTINGSVAPNPNTGLPYSGFLASGGIKPNGTIPAEGRGIPVLGCTTAQACRDATSAYLYDQQLPYAITWNLGIQRVLRNDYTVEIRYLGTRGVHLFTQSRINVGSVVTPTRFLPTYLSAPNAATLASLNLTAGDLFTINPILPAWQPYFNNTLVTGFPNRGNSVYHGLAMELTRRFARNLLFKGAYTWSHNIDDSTADIFSTLLSPRRPEDFQNMRPERSSSFLDRRHRFTYNWVYDLPWYRRSDNRLLRYALGGFTLSGTYTYESPQFATVQSSLDSNLNFDSAADRAIVNPDGVPNTGSAVRAINQSGATVGMGDDSTVAYVALNPNAQYIQAGYGARTNSGRQTLPSRPINNWDLQVKKEFFISERYRFQLGVQMINAFNHPQYVPGYINIVQFHDSRETRNHLIPGNSLFNRPDLVYASNARFLQLTARIQF